jgi:DNA replication licensing factor MCM2
MLTNYLFDMNRDYAIDARLDRYDEKDINDEEEFESMDPAARRAAEQAMERRDRATGGPGRRARLRDRMPNFLSDGLSEDFDDDGDETSRLLAGMKPRVRKQYDERKDVDDAEGIEDVSDR